MTNKINILSATEARKDWSLLIDTVVHDKPQFIKRTRDYVMMMNIGFLESLLEAYSFTANKYVEDDNSVTLSLNEIDIIENGTTEDDARDKLAKGILEYAEDFYNDFHYWSVMPNRKNHIPYVLKVLILQDIGKIGDLIRCQNGKI